MVLCWGSCLVSNSAPKMYLKLSARETDSQKALQLKVLASLEGPFEVVSKALTMVLHSPPVKSKGLERYAKKAPRSEELSSEPCWKVEGMARA